MSDKARDSCPTTTLLKASDAAMQYFICFSRPISLLFVLMAVSVGAFALGTAQRRSGAPNRWFLTVSAAASLGFACSFIAVGFGWVRLGPPPSYWIWMSCYFAFTALCMLSMAVRLHGIFSVRVAASQA